MAEHAQVCESGTESADMTFTEALFPPTNRVLYAHSPLAQVICQIRFPSILRIESQAPADFQDRIRGTFPILERNGTFSNPQFPPEIIRLMGIEESTSSYVFRTEDGNYSLTLGGGSIALTCSKYIRWEDLWSKLQMAMDAFVEIYRPSFYTRIGLRYINVIQRSSIGLEGRSWSAMLREELLGELRLPQWETRALEARRSIRVLMSNDAGAVFLQHGLVRTEASPELGYNIDFDFYSDKKVEVGNASNVLEKFHDRSGRAFRWCITDALHEALGPQEPDH